VYKIYKQKWKNMTVNASEGETRLASKLTGQDPELSKKAENLNDGEYLTGPHVIGAAVTGLTINPQFNMGVEHGPWKALDEKVQHYTDDGWTTDEALAYLDSLEKERKIGVNTYPFGPTGDLAELSNSLIDEAHSIAREVDDRIEQEQNKE
jgi:hypothetical protein